MKTIKLTKKEYKKLVKSIVEKTAKDIIDMIGESTTIIYKDKPIEVVKKPINVPNSPLKPTDKKQEMIESLEYLKKKPVKSKQDKISIDMLEAVLKNMM
jgi:23S rRNA-/tRNA-specific pseudouridylate synthase